MKTRLLSIFALVALTVSVQAQETRKVDDSVLAKADAKKSDGWEKGGVVGLNLGQTALKNWAGGGQSAVSGTGLVSLFGNYQKGKSAWDNSLDLAYGLLSQDNGPFLKSDDRIELNSKYGRQFAKSDKWYYGGLVNFRSQFAEGYETPAQANIISKFMAPAYLTAAIGLDYKPNKYLSVFIAPISSRTTFVMDNSLNAIGAFGVDTNSTYRAELGGLFMAKFTKEILKNVGLKTQVTLFSNYMDNPQNVDVLWDLLLDMKVNKYISASISTTLIYDHDILINKTDEQGASYQGRDIQFKEVLNIGFSYKF